MQFFLIDLGAAIAALLGYLALVAMKRRYTWIASTAPGRQRPLSAAARPGGAQAVSSAAIRRTLPRRAPRLGPHAHTAFARSGILSAAFVLARAASCVAPLGTCRCIAARRRDTHRHDFHC